MVYPINPTPPHPLLLPFFGQLFNTRQLFGIKTKSVKDSFWCLNFTLVPPMHVQTCKIKPEKIAPIWMTKIVVTYIKAVSNSQLPESKQICTISLLCKIQVWSEMRMHFIYLWSLNKRERELGGTRQQSSFTRHTQSKKIDHRKTNWSIDIN